jgi:hypothetical protein
MLMTSLPEAFEAPVETRLIDVVDRLLDCGIALRGDIWLTVAGVDLVYIGAQIVIASPDVVSPPPPSHRPPARGAA